MIIQNARSHHILQMTFDHQAQMLFFHQIKPSLDKKFSQLHLVHQYIKINTLQQMLPFYCLYKQKTLKNTLPSNL